MKENNSQFFSSSIYCLKELFKSRKIVEESYQRCASQKGHTSQAKEEERGKQSFLANLHSELFNDLLHRERIEEAINVVNITRVATSNREQFVIVSKSRPDHTDDTGLGTPKQVRSPDSTSTDVTASVPKQHDFIGLAVTLEQLREAVVETTDDERAPTHLRRITHLPVEIGRDGGQRSYRRIPCRVLHGRHFNRVLDRNQ